MAPDAEKRASRLTRRNPGPSWGYSFLLRADGWLPAGLFDFLLGVGTWVAVAAMPSERRSSREYLEAVFGRPARHTEVWRHFYAFARSLMTKLRAGNGRSHACSDGPDCGPFLALMAGGRPALLGTFHFGNSDLLGFLLEPFDRPVAMIRLRVENSSDTRRLVERLGGRVSMIWVNETEDLLFVLKDVVQSGRTVAMKCDRLGYSSKLEAFEFLGRRRLFPFTIYHLAMIFRLPVVFCVSVPEGRDGSRVHGSAVFDPGGDSKEEALARARVHFQEFLRTFEDLLRQDPYLWFNFVPLNPDIS